MKVLGLTLCLRDDPEKITAYRQHHQAVWPDVTARLRECGVYHWNELMATLQERAPEANQDEWWAPMDMVFDLNWPQHQGTGQSP